MSKHQERVTKKNRLIERINAQRVSLSQCTEQLLNGTENFDRGWEALFRMRAFIALGVGVVVVKAIRKKPSRFYFWPRRALGIWSASRLVKSTLSRK
ncbi:YqjK-like family protein [Serratia liquefaciens]|uniref:YqjK-like family protein n=1 Tax=Serratia liquefaciens TaxID=614 RepID=UPI0022B9DBDB|nr:YqjK-like family protein [Serratia liquefaciens]